MEIPLTEQQANDLYDVLVLFAGAHPSWRENFVHVHTRESYYQFGSTEYRFGGSLGFGGKLRIDPHPLPGRAYVYVDQYREDETFQSLAVIHATNLELRKMFGYRPQP